MYCKPAVVGSLHCCCTDSVKAPVLVCCGHVSFVCVCVYTYGCECSPGSFVPDPSGANASEGRKGLVKIGKFL